MYDRRTTFHFNFIYCQKRKCICKELQSKKQYAKCKHQRNALADYKTHKDRWCKLQQAILNNSAQSHKQFLLASKVCHRSISMMSSWAQEKAKNNWMQANWAATEQQKIQSLLIAISGLWRSLRFDWGKSSAKVLGHRLSALCSHNWTGCCQSVLQAQGQ